MLTGKRIALIGGDERYLQVIHHLAQKNAEVYIEGFSEIDFEQKNVLHRNLEELNFNYIDTIVLPILGMDENRQIELSYPEGKIALTEEMIKQTPDTCVIYTGTANDTLKSVAKKCDRKLVILFERDDIAIANSIPTAEATLQIAMEETNHTIHDANVVVTGFGRVGNTIARLFHQVGANVTVAARKQADFARIRELRMQPVPISQLGDVIKDTDICINTIPHLVVKKDEIRSMENSLIIDVASKPGGVDFEAAKDVGIKAIHALGLPGIVAPKTAGDIIGHTISELIKENESV